MKTLNIYPSDFPHSEAWIVGTKESLISLRDQIDEAINQIAMGSASVEVFDNHGESYKILIVSVNDERISLDNLRPHYAKLTRSDGENPIDFIGAGRYFSLVEPSRGYK